MTKKINKKELLVQTLTIIILCGKCGMEEPFLSPEPFCERCLISSIGGFFADVHSDLGLAGNAIGRLHRFLQELVRGEDTAHQAPPERKYFTV